jgi:peptidoglycan/LPS O-acetylase OafA/YrhL
VLSLVIALQSSLPETQQLVPFGAVSLHLRQISYDLFFIPFMFAGTMYSYHIRGQVTTARLMGAVALLFGIFVLTLPHTVLKQFMSIPLNYFYALCVFSAAYALRRHCRPLSVVDWLASISYPLYALHTLIGYVSQRYLTAIGVPYYLAVAIAVALVVAAATAVHHLIEVPTQEWGKRIMKGKSAGTEAVQGRGVDERAVPARFR